MDDNKKNPDSQIVSQIDINIEWEAISPREMFLDEYSFCPLCGDELMYVHVTEFVSQSVCEQAFCNSCHVQVKKNSHALQ